MLLAGDNLNTVSVVSDLAQSAANNNGQHRRASDSRPFGV